LKLVKINIIGDGYVGKSALLGMYVRKTFKANYMNTIGADCIVYSTSVDGNDIKFQIWDLAGQPKYETVRPIYYGGSVGLIVVYDITREETFKNAINWLEEAFKYTGRGPVPVVLVANKEDLRGEIPHPMTKKHGIELVKKIDEQVKDDSIISSFIETSAKTGQNVDEAFKILGKNILTYIEELMKVTIESGIRYGKRNQRI
jgi:small GTP-binding protein